MDFPAASAGKELVLLMGRIDDVDETCLNGVRIGGLGGFPPDYSTAWDVDRRYRVPAGLVHGDGSDVLAVRVFNGNGEGGIRFSIEPRIRGGPFDEVDSVGGNRTGCTASFQMLSHATLPGRCLAILRPTGRSREVVLRAAADGLLPAELKVRIR